MASILEALQPHPEDRLHLRLHRARSVVLTSQELVEIRAAQRTFEGAYMRTALSQFSLALVVLKIFTSEFYPIGALLACYGAAVLLVAAYRRYEGNRQFFDDVAAPRAPPREASESREREQPGVRITSAGAGADRTGGVDAIVHADEQDADNPRGGEGEGGEGEGEGRASGFGMGTGAGPVRSSSTVSFAGSAGARNRRSRQHPQEPHQQRHPAPPPPVPREPVMVVKKKFRTSGNSVGLLVVLSLVSYVALIVLVWQLGV